MGVDERERDKYYKLIPLSLPDPYANMVVK